jgi:hypothetical protein
LTLALLLLLLLLHSRRDDNVLPRRAVADEGSDRGACDARSGPCRPPRCPLLTRQLLVCLGGRGVCRSTKAEAARSRGLRRRRARGCGAIPSSSPCSSKASEEAAGLSTLQAPRATGRRPRGFPQGQRHRLLVVAATGSPDAAVICSGWRQAQ